jgi:hypothetical protein
MTRRARGRSCVALLAALFSLVLAPVRHYSASLYNPVPDRPTFNSTALIAALPRVLSPPVLKPGSRLVSMIAEDIDADGDLDVVANDGSLNLIVWTNDGSGRLSPRQSREVAGLQSEPGAPTVSHQSNQFDSVVPASSAPLDTGARIVVLAPAASPLLSATSASALLQVFVSTRAPRGPPSALLLS